MGDSGGHDTTRDPKPRSGSAGEPVRLPPLPTAPAPPQPERVEFRLAVLDCPTCGAALDAEGADVVFYCTACRNGYRLDRAEDRRAPAALVPVDVAFLSVPDVAAERWFPFWRLPATVRIESRADSVGGSGGGRVHLRDLVQLTRFFTDPDPDPEIRAPVGDRVTFAVPAFEAGVESLQRLIYEYTFRAPDRGDRIGERLTGGVYGVRDAEKLAHYALITAEIRRPATLRELRYEIEFGEPSLLGVPAVRQGEGWQDALFSVPF